MATASYSYCDNREIAQQTEANQLALIGYIKLSRVRSYLLTSSHVTCDHYVECLNTMDSALTEVLSMTGDNARSAAMDYVLFTLDWK